MKYQVEKISRKIKIEKIIQHTIKGIVIIFLTILLLINLAMLYQTESNSEEIPRIFNMSIFNIISESMTPTIEVNDLIVVKECKRGELEVGNIITYKKSDNTIVTHRIVRIERNVQTKYVTQGDNNETEDVEKILYNQIYGKYMFRIKKAGRIVEIIKKNNGIISIIIIIILFIILKNGNDKKREKRKKVREKYELKKKRDEYNKN